MKKLIASLFIGFALVGPGRPAFADLTDIEGTILDHVEAVTQVQSGQTSVALLDSVILIGKYKGMSIGHVQAGVTSTIDGNPPSWLAGFCIRLDPFLKNLATLPEHYQFLKSIQHGPALHYNFREKVWRGSYNVSLAFGLEPKK
jgi:hypothetical protein